MRSHLVKYAATGALASAAAAMTGQAQSADALIDKLVEKGVLTVKEGNELREEADKGFTSAYQVKSGMPDWVNALKINGDFRGRYEAFISPNDDFADRYRWRYRFRLGITALLKDNFEVGIRLASGESNDPISSNQTMTDNASKKAVWTDLAYMKWSPINSPEWAGSVTFGKMINPFIFTDMVFDNDYTPEGLGVNLNYSLSSKHVLAMNGGAFVLDEIGAQSDDPYMFGAQVLLNSTWSPKLTTSAGVAFLAITEVGSLSNAAVPNSNEGNTRYNVGTAAAPVFIPRYNFNPIVGDLSATYNLDSAPMYNGAFPITVSGELIYNPAAGGDNDYGWNAGLVFGKASKRNTWELSYTYKWLGANAWYDEVVDSDFGALYVAAPPGGRTGYASGTNVRGNIVKVAYAPLDFLVLSGKWFGTQLIDPSPAGSDSTMNRIQFDAMVKF